MRALEGSKSIVTGASSGIGRAIALALGGAGSQVLAIARREELLRQMMVELEGCGAPEPRYAVLDVRDRHALDRVASDQAAFFTSADILVNNAGLARGKDFLCAGNEEDWDEMIDTNLKSVLSMIRRVVPGMIARQRGHVVNIGSISGRDVYRGGGVYCATKFALNAVTKTLRLEVLGTGVRVTSVDPGLVETEFSKVRFRDDSDKAAEPYRGLAPLTAEDVARAVLYAVTQPAHVAVADLCLLPTDQASVADTIRR